MTIHTPHSGAVASNERGRQHLARGELREAALAFAEAVERDPAFAIAHSNLAVALWQAGHGDEALHHFRQATALEPDNPRSHNNLGRALQEHGVAAEALTVLERAAALSPDDAEIRFNRALALLQNGQFTQGWAEYEWRGRLPRFQSRARPFAQPRWDGGALDGRTILIHAEQGLGDTLQFVRFVHLVRERGGRVILEVQPALKGLLAGLEGPQVLIARGEPLPPFDCHAPLLSLPHLLGSGGTFPGAEGYLKTPESTLPRTPGRPVVGLAWAGASLGRLDQVRSLPLDRLWGLVMPRAWDWVALQVGEPAKVLEKHSLAARIQIPPLPDFSATAAVIAGLDLVISIDGVVAHLAGALGRPVWTVLAHGAEWRWGTNGETSPWYASMRLFRQGPERAWGPVLAHLGAALDRRFERLHGA
ncbi:MAG: tetratricopeptide repeat protein [Magnetococcales bacterium]|nr:tetratricopeptide repeat protein [Magnetococcales bacterium]